jgi:hypothetical protein
LSIENCQESLESLELQLKLVLDLIVVKKVEMQVLAPWEKQGEGI